MRRLSHLAITPDGNRRYAKKHGLNFEAAYKAGFDKISQVLDWSSEPEQITLWALSLDNFRSRSDFELRILYRLMRKHIDENLESRKFREEGVSVRFFGRREELPRGLDEKFSLLEEKTGGGGRRLNIAVAYSGRDEILNAAKALARDAEGGKIDLEKFGEKDFEKYLYNPDSPDLVIRTGDAQRLSGLMPWQTAYSEIYFSKKLWPEFEKADYDEALAFYARTESRKGK